MTVFIIAEAGSSWDCDESKAFRLIEAAKACGADAVKFQWTSNAKSMAERRLGANAARSIEMYKRYLEYPLDVLKRLKAHCDSVSIEFMCSTFLIEDVAVIAPLVRMFKISAFESQWREFVSAHCVYEKPLVISVNPGQKRLAFCQDINFLHCVSKYPTPVNEIELRYVNHETGLSDHTANVQTGAAAAARKAPIVEAHIRLITTKGDNPDYDHSLVADCGFPRPSGRIPFEEYVQNIRTVERML